MKTKVDTVEKRFPVSVFKKSVANKEVENVDKVDGESTQLSCSFNLDKGLLDRLKVTWYKDNIELQGSQIQIDQEQVNISSQIYW